MMRLRILAVLLQKQSFLTSEWMGTLKNKTTVKHSNIPVPHSQSFQLRGSGSDSSSDSDARRGTGEVSLKLAALESLHNRADSVELSTYALNGTDVDRLKGLLSDPICPCKCTLPLKIVSKICGSFWTLPKENQDALLWSLQCESGRSRKKFSIEGEGFTKLPLILHVGKVSNSSIVFLALEKSSCPPQKIDTGGFQLCRASWLRLLGIGKQRWQRTRKRFRGIDDRTLPSCSIASTWREIKIIV